MSEVIEYKSIAEPPAIPRNHIVRTTCYLCGSTGDLTREHVVPRTFFTPHSNPRPVVLMACRKCNHKKSLEDQYIARYLQATSFNDKALKGIEASINKQQARSKVLKQGSRPVGHGLYYQMGSDTEMIDFHSPAGLNLGKSPALRFNTQRFENYLHDLVKGLWVANTLESFDWSHYDFKSDYYQAVQNTDYLYKPPFSDVWQKGNKGQMWRGILSYKAAIIDKTWAATWVMVFYNSHIAVVSCYDKRKLSEIERRAKKQAKT